MSKIFPGTYRARIVNWAISNNSKDNPQAEVLFEFNDGSTAQVGGQFHQIRWWGQFTGSEKAQAYTLKTLAMLGFKGKTDEDFAKLADGVEGGMLDLAAEVDLVIEEAAKEDGTPVTRIKYINTPGYAPGGFKNAMSKGEAKVKLGALNLAGQMAMVRQQMGSPANQAPKPAPAATKAPGPTNVRSDDVDFDFGI